jgi:hypothetical protein
LAESLKNKPEIIGHVDIIKKNNINSKYFNEKDNWYLDIVDNYLKEIKKIGCVVEVIREAWQDTVSTACIRLVRYYADKRL